MIRLVGYMKYIKLVKPVGKWKDDEDVREQENMLESKASVKRKEQTRYFIFGNKKWNKQSFEKRMELQELSLTCIDDSIDCKVSWLSIVLV